MSEKPESECTECKSALLEHEVEHPQKGANGDVVCDDCYRECYEANDLRAEIARLHVIVAQLPKWADSLVDAENQLHGIRHTKMAKDSIRYVEKKLREAAKQGGA